MAKRGNVAVDINPAFVDLANQMRNVIAHVADITTTSLAPIHDIAVCSEVLEHVPDPRSSLKNIYSSLKPGLFGPDHPELFDDGAHGPLAGLSARS